MQQRSSFSYDALCTSSTVSFGERELQVPVRVLEELGNGLVESGDHLVDRLLPARLQVFPHLQREFLSSINYLFYHISNSYLILEKPYKPYES